MTVKRRLDFSPVPGRSIPQKSASGRRRVRPSHDQTSQLKIHAVAELQIGGQTNRQRNVPVVAPNRNVFFRR
jgi:hypothetical protein